MLVFSWIVKQKIISLALPWSTKHTEAFVQRFFHSCRCRMCTNQRSFCRRNICWANWWPKGGNPSTQKRCPFPFSGCRPAVALFMSVEVTRMTEKLPKEKKDLPLRKKTRFSRGFLSKIPSFHTKKRKNASFVFVPGVTCTYKCPFLSWCAEIYHCSVCFLLQYVYGEGIYNIPCIPPLPDFEAAFSNTLRLRPQFRARINAIKRQRFMPQGCYDVNTGPVDNIWALNVQRCTQGTYIQFQCIYTTSSPAPTPSDSSPSSRGSTTPRDGGYIFPWSSEKETSATEVRGLQSPPTVSPGVEYRTSRPPDGGGQGSTPHPDSATSPGVHIPSPPGVTPVVAENLSSASSNTITIVISVGAAVLGLMLIIGLLLLCRYVSLPVFGTSFRFARRGVAKPHRTKLRVPQKIFFFREIRVGCSKSCHFHLYLQVKVTSSQKEMLSRLKLKNINFMSIWQKLMIFFLTRLQWRIFNLEIRVAHDFFIFGMCCDRQIWYSADFFPAHGNFIGEFNKPANKWTQREFDQDEKVWVY